MSQTLLFPSIGRLLFTAALLSSSFSTGSAFADGPTKFSIPNMVNIEVGDLSRGKGPTATELRAENFVSYDEYAALAQRTRRLEQAVLQLQQTIYDLETSRTPATQTAPATQSTPTVLACYINTPFGDVYTGKGASLGEAKAETLKACQTAGGHFNCKASAVKCD